MFDIQRFLSDYNVQWWPLNRDNISMSCPFDDMDQGRGHFNISTVRPIYHCYRCGKSGHYIGLVMKVAYLSFEEAQQLVSGTIRFRDDKRVDSSPTPCELPRKSFWTRGMRIYLEGRNFWEMAKDVGAFPTNDWPITGRVVFPIVVNGVPVSYQARTVKNEKPKYRTPKGAKLGQIVYGWEWLNRADWVVLVEGIFDCLRLWQLEIPAAATFGAKISHEQVKLLHDAGIKETVLLMDADVIPTNLRSMYDRSSSYFHTRLACLPEGDPADYSGVKEVLGRATDSYTEYCLQKGEAFATTSTGC